MYPSDELQFGRITIPDSSSSSTNPDNDDETYTAQRTYGIDNSCLLGNMEFFSSDLEFSGFNSVDQEFNFAQYQTDNVDYFYDIATPSLQEDMNKLASIQSKTTPALIEPGKEKEFSFGILKNLGSRFRQFNSEYQDHTSPLSKRCSTLKIVQMAGEKFIKSFSQGINDMSDLSHPFDSSSLGLTEEENRDIELVQDLLSSAEKVGQQEFERATSLLDYSDDVAFIEGNLVQRLVHYFSLALREKIERETGKITEKGLGKKQAVNMEVALMSPTLGMIAFHRRVPFCQVAQFASIQAVIDNVEGSRRIHIIDLEIRSGTHWSILMQALTVRSDCPLEHLKITAIGTKKKAIIDGTGNRLTQFARSMNIPFSFNVIMVNDMTELNADLFDLDEEETVAVYSPNSLWSMIVQPSQLDCLMRVIQMINPKVMVVKEIEANHNSANFIVRFTEALFYNAAFFDCVEECMGTDDPDKIVAESLFFGYGIRNIVACENEERTIRHVNVKMWRSFFARFGMKDVALSMSSVYQANLMIDNFDCASSCTLQNDGNCLLIGWKGTPLISLSAWKFE